MKKISLILLSVLVIIGLALGLSYFWLTSSSVYAAHYNFSKSIKDKNLEETKKYMDIQKVTDSYFESIQQFTGGLIKKEDIGSGLEKAISNGRFIKTDDLPNSPLQSFNSKKLTKEGSEYKLKAPLFISEGSQETFDSELFFTKEGSEWKITKIKIDLSKLLTSTNQQNSQPEVKTQEVKLDSEITTSKFKVKVSKIEYFPVLESTNELTKEKILLKLINSENIFAKISFEATNISNSGSYFSLVPSIETQDNKIYKPEYRENLYLFEKTEENTDTKLDFSTLLNPNSKGSGVKILEVPANNKESQKVLIEDKEDYPQQNNYKWFQ